MKELLNLTKGMAKENTQVVISNKSMKDPGEVISKMAKENI